MHEINKAIAAYVYACLLRNPAYMLEETLILTTTNKQ